jgi:hypothetical protein
LISTQFVGKWSYSNLQFKFFILDSPLDFKSALWAIIQSPGL